MRICGLIVEYNPLHVGHMHHIKEAQRLTQADLTVAVMSSHVVQRGDFAVVDKFTRTQWALKSGIDLVIELPAFYVLQSADAFADAAVTLLHAVGVTDVVFGSESSDIAPLYKALKLYRDAQFQLDVKAHLDAGKSYASAHGLAFEARGLSALNQPNNMLGLQYLKAIENHGFAIQAHAIKRLESGYHDGFDAQKNIQSATAIRNQLFDHQPLQNSVASFVQESLERLPLNRLEHYQDGLNILLRTLSATHLESLFSIDEGLENRLQKTPFDGALFAYLEALKTPRYTYAKLRRSLMHVLCQTPKTFQSYPSPPYVRILGMNVHGQKQLNIIKKNPTLPIITKLTRERHPLLDYELKVTQLYALKTSAKLNDKEFAPCIRTTLKDPLVSAIMT